MGRKAPRKRLACRVMCRPHGCSAEHPNVSRRSAHPSIRVGEAKVANPGRRHAPRERDGLFDIVSWKLPKTVRRGAAGSAVLILRSAHAEGAPRNSKGRVRASRRMRTGDWVRPHASRCIAAHLDLWKRLRSPCCDAPQHEGCGARRMRVWSERSTNLRLWELVAGSAPLFPDCYLQ